jgi:NADH/NAD ratio-sensing transcriptional regulator Rex
MQATLVALNEFKRYLESLEKELSRTSKKYSNREIAQGVGFVAAGIHEALSYLEIVKKVIVKTERGVAKRNALSETTPPSE